VVRLATSLEEKFRASASDQHPSCDRRDYAIAKTLHAARGDSTLMDAAISMISDAEREQARLHPSIPFRASYCRCQPGAALSLSLSFFVASSITASRYFPADCLESTIVSDQRNFCSD